MPARGVPRRQESGPRERRVLHQVRNNIEHRYEQLLATALAGKMQAHVLNYEEALTAWFGADEGLGDDLRVPVFVSSLTPDAVKALEATHRKLPQKINDFIREHDPSLPAEVAEDWRYDFRVLLLPQTGGRRRSTRRCGSCARTR